MENKHKAAILLILAIMSQWFHQLFIGHVHSYYVRDDNKLLTEVFWSDMVYFLIDEIVTFVYVIIACAVLWKDSATKSIMSGVFGWYLVEVIEIILKFFNIIDIRTPKTIVGTWQISTAVSLMIIVYIFGRKLQA